MMRRVTTGDRIRSMLLLVSLAAVGLGLFAPAGCVEDYDLTVCYQGHPWLAIGGLALFLGLATEWWMSLRDVAAWKTIALVTLVLAEAMVVVALFGPPLFRP